MSTEIASALTPAEWAAREANRPTYWAFIAERDELQVQNTEIGDDMFIATGKDRHALAALALYGLPEGFTHDDVRRHTELAESHEREAHGLDLVTEGIGFNGARYGEALQQMHAARATAEWHRSMAARLAALLPEAP